MATVMKRTGFGQVEPNHLSGIVEGKIYAQLPVDATMGKVIENGRFAKYNMKDGKVKLEGDGPWMMIYNEQKLYDERRQGLKDFALVASDFVGEEIVPRLIYIEVGDIFTTNTFKVAAKSADDVIPNADVSLILGDKVYIQGADGYLDKTENENSPVFQVVKEYSMPDGQPGVKLMRIQ